jgi:UDP-N-acetylmuramoyl-L-alanyl-D-glutamate--2,6-diaminopimelate ligase
MNLQDVLAGVELVQRLADASADISHLACHTGKIEVGTLFFALRGANSDGNQYVKDAIGRGAVAIASEQPRRPEIPDQVLWVQLRDGRKGLALAAANFYGLPARALKLVAVTGTNGKTTTTHLIDSILKATGRGTGLFGTIAYHTPRGEYPSPNTTPESLDLQEFLAEIRDAGGKFAVLEASSHALAMDRLWGCHFDAAIFTNLTREHLDYHKTFDDYFAAKRRLFEGTGAGMPQVGVINTDDAYGRLLAGVAKSTLSYGLENDAHITTAKFALSFSGLRFTAQTPIGKIEVESPLVGRINVYNILAAVGAAVALGTPRDAIEKGIRSLESVSGRFQRIEMGQPFLIIVDYAHTDDALEHLIRTAHELNPKGRIITLFGCGGGKDRTKRPVMGEVAGKQSDLVVLSSDNPRNEDPLRIISDIVVGLQKVQGKYVIEPDREKAIGVAFDYAQAGDIVLLCGKGHERYQILGDRTLEFDEREVARRVLRERGFGT